MAAVTRRRSWTPRLPLFQLNKKLVLYYELNSGLRAALKPFYGVLKSSDAFLRFVMLTGVTRFSKVSIFSDMNQLREIGLSPDYACVCAITEKELLENFKPDIEDTAERSGKTFEEMLGRLRRDFNGYHFTKNSESVYNPFSLLNTFANHDIRYYWFASGTPTFLFHELERTKFDVLQFDGGISIEEAGINYYQPGDTTPVPLLYQSGYLTIAGYDADKQRYKLDFPNEEVRYGFFSNLLPGIMGAPRDRTGFYIGEFSASLKNGDMETFFTQLTAFFALIPYDLNPARDEKYFQTIFYVALVLLGHFVEVEVRSAVGRADAVVKTKNTIYVFEFKVDKNGAAEDALKQIDEKGYLIPYTADGRKLVKAGVVFDTEKRAVGEWKTE